VHHLQAEAKLVTTPTLGSLLKEFHRDKLVLRERHVAVARHVGDYAFNNTYQYVINREDVHLSWLEAALEDLGETPDTVPEPQVSAPAKGHTFVSLVREDATQARAFVDRWRDRLPQIGNARHRNMMQVIIGEVIEQRRFFDQMIAGREDLLGRRANGHGSPGTGNGVLPVRWIE
jgi:hypothetical protein